MNPIESWVRRFDHFQQSHVVLAFPWAVMQKAGNDQAGAFAARVAYYGLFALFPLLLLLTTLLGFVLEGNPHLQHQILNTALANFPIIGDQLKKSAHSLTGSGLGLAIGLAGTIYGTFGLGQSVQEAMNSVWNIPYVKWPNYFLRRLRALIIFAILGLAVLGAGALSTYSGHISGVGSYVSYAGSVVINFCVFLAAFIVLTAEPLKFRDVWLGVVLSTLFWQVLLAVGTWYVAHSLSHASPTYGFFAIVIALLSWMYLVAQFTLMAAEINVVLKYRLWPRTITQPPLIEGDRRTFARLAAQQVRRPEYGVDVEFKPAANEDPLDQDRPDDGHQPSGETVSPEPRVEQNPSPGG